MNKDVLVVSLGPVQGVFRSSRKTRDLSRGSQLLSLIAARAVERARSLAGVDVVVPASRAGTSDYSGLSNKLIMLVESGHAEQVAAQLRGACDDALAAVARTALDACPSGSIDSELFGRQVSQFLECYWAAAPVGDQGFGQARERAEAALDGRKALRDFGGYIGVGGRNKASVDGQLDGVLEKPERLRSRRPSAASAGEQVDAIGLIRRLVGSLDRRPAPSTTEIAAGPWLRAVGEIDGGAEALDAVVTARNALIDTLAKVSHDGGAQLDRDSLVDADALDSAAWVLDDNYLSLKRFEDELRGLTGVELDDAATRCLREFRTACEKARTTGRDIPRSPYYAIVSADGDRIGRALSALPGAAEHAKASAAMAAFAGEVIKAGDRHGVHVVYAGGDDVLALAPLDQALPFTREIQDAFASVRALLGDVSLSAGLLIVHRGDRLADAVEAARAAEREAKEATRQAATTGHMSVVLSKRGGADVSFVFPATKHGFGALDALICAVRAGKIPRGTAYDVRDLARRLEGVANENTTVAAIELALGRKRDRDGRPLPAEYIDGLLALADVHGRTSSAAVKQACEAISGAIRVAAHFATHTVQGDRA